MLALAGSARADHHTVKVAKSDKLGAHLTDAKGMTLYVFRKDSAGKSACAGDCVAKWPLYYRENVGVSAHLKSADFATISREEEARDEEERPEDRGIPQCTSSDGAGKRSNCDDRPKTPRPSANGVAETVLYRSSGMVERDLGRPPAPLLVRQILRSNNAAPPKWPFVD